MTHFGKFVRGRTILVISPYLNDNLERLVCERGHLHDFPVHVEECNIAENDELSRAERVALINELYRFFDETNK